MSVSGSTCSKSSGADDVTKEQGGGPDVVLEGVDVSGLTAREKREWSQYVSELLSPCRSVPVPIAQCVTEKRACSKCVPAAKFVLRSVKEGLTREQVERKYKNRFDPDKVKNVPIDGSPSRGPEGAPVTIVEFADFECPHCAEYAGHLDKVIEKHKDDVRFVFKFYPLPSHPHADSAARAAIAAGNQGKFWEMHHSLFTNQRRLEQSDIDRYAKELGLDVSRLHADMQAQATTERIEKDKKLGEDLAIGGTPSIFVNGRTFELNEDLPEWIKLEIAGDAKPAAGEASAKAPSSAAPSATAPSAPAGSAPKK